MKPTFGFIKIAFVLSVLFVVSCQTIPPPTGMGDARCDNVSEKGFINFLDINLLALEVQN